MTREDIIAILQCGLSWRTVYMGRAYRIAEITPEWIEYVTTALLEKQEEPTPAFRRIRL